jgi:hypothetical protein
MYALELSHDYAASEAELFAAVGAGSLFVARGAMPSTVSIDLRDGGEFSFERGGGGLVTGVVTRVEHGALIEIEWAGMRATMHFEKCPRGSRVHLAHSGIPTEELRDAFADGWRIGLRRLVLPPLFPEERAATGDEAHVLTAFLAYQRHVMTGKLNGLSEADARRRVVPSLTTPIGLVRHLTFVEREWFGHWLAQRPTALSGNDGSDGWTVPAHETVASVIAEYEAACAESDRIAAGLPLSHHVPHPRLGWVSLRWIYTHMIEETARHAGHLDILRELIDGVTGVDP